MCSRHAAVSRAATVVVLGLFARVALAQYEAPNAAYNPPTGYYDAANSTDGAMLKSQLFSIISTKYNETTHAHSGALTGVSYDNLRYAERVLFKDMSWVPTAQDPYDHILNVYDRVSHDYLWDAGATWNREHSWPQSWLGVSASGTNAASDEFEVFPATTSGNGDRQNFGYGYYPTTGLARVVTSGGKSFWYPGDADSGDVARSMFYMATRYGQSQSNGINLYLVNGAPTVVGQMGDLNSLLHWNYEDGVDNFERRRSWLAYTTDASSAGWDTTPNANDPNRASVYNKVYNQGNRNPFIDHPEYVWAIFGGGVNNSQIYAGSTPNADGSSNAAVNLRVMKNGVMPTGSATINKTGADPTTFDLTATSNVVAAANVIGTGQPFDYGTQSKTFSVGLSDSTATTGAKTGSLTINNTDLTTGGAGEGSVDGNDTINVTAQVVDNRVITASNADFGRVIVGSPVTTDTTLTSTGDDNHFTRVTVKAAGTSADVNGVFITAGSDQTFNGTLTTATRTLQGTFTNPGLASGVSAFTVQNAETSISGTPSVQPVNVSYSVSIYDHAHPSLAAGAITTTKTIDFGYVPAGFAARTVCFDVYDNADAYGVPFTAALDVDGVTATGSGLMTTNVPGAGGDQVAPGSSPRSYVASFTPDTVPGAATAMHTIATSDEDIPGATVRSNLVITTTGRTFTAATFPVTGFLNLLNGETLNTGAFSIQSNVTLTKSGPGTMNIDAVQTNGSNSGLSVTAGVVNVGTDAGSAGDAPLSLAASAAGVVHLNAPQHLHSLSATGGHVNVAAGGSNLIVADQVAASGGGAIDLRDNSMIVHGAAGAWNGASYTGVAGLIASGRNGGSWDGSGIVTSESLAVGPNALTTLAVASAADALHLGPGATTSWDGESISDSDTLVKYTYAGDADLSGRIDADDYFAIDSGYAHPANPSYASGDFNYDGAINGDDYFLIDSNYLAQTMTFAVPENLPVASAPEAIAAGVVQAVPEPFGGAVWLLAASILGRRKRTHR